MKKISCLLFDDEPNSLQILLKFASQNPFLSIKGSFSNVQMGLEYALKNPPDLIITNLDMLQVSGLVLWERLHQNSWFIFASDFTQLMKQASGEKVVDTLLKPYSQRRFQEAIDKSINMITEEKIRQGILTQLHTLSDAEKLIVLKIGAFKESKEIAKETFNSIRTIDNHRNNIRKKLKFTKPFELQFFAVSALKYFDEL